MRSPFTQASLSAPPPAAVATNPQFPTSQAEIITAVNPRVPLIDQGIKEEMSDLKACIKGHSASLATLERTQQASVTPSTSTSLTVSPVGLSDLRVIEGSVPTPVQSSTSMTSKARGESFN